MVLDVGSLCPRKNVCQHLQGATQALDLKLLLFITCFTTRIALLLFSPSQHNYLLTFFSTSAADVVMPLRLVFTPIPHNCFHVDYIGLSYKLDSRFFLGISFC